MIHFEKELILAKEAAIAAGKILLSDKKHLNHSIYSSDKDIKLKADIKAEDLIKNILNTNSKFPILAEESGKSSNNLGEIFWVVDPLDGTANYSRNISLCCVSIALIQNLKPVLGVIYDFNNNDLYEGSINSKAVLNEKEIYVSDVLFPSDGILITGLPNDTDYSDHSLMEMIKGFQKWRKVRMLGSAALAAAYVASGKADLYKEKRTYLWDVAAGAAIVEAAGGCVTMQNHNNLNQVDVFFSNSKIIE
jgi:myo-inositol-1(or 4)-monophosphatase